MKKIFLGIKHERVETAIHADTAQEASEIDAMDCEAYCEVTEDDFGWLKRVLEDTFGKK